MEKDYEPGTLTCLFLGVQKVNMKPMISYYGGKQQMVRHLLPLIPPHSIYCEPFCGGASLFFEKEFPVITNKHSYREVLNDTNGELINLYHVARLRKEEFLEQLNAIPYSERIYKKFKRNACEQDELTLAVGFYIRIMMSFAKKLDCGFAFSKYGQNNSLIHFNHLERLPKIIDRLKGVFIFDRDALDIIKRFDCPEAFFYCDPPYPDTNQGAYSGYTQDHFEELLDMISKCQGSFMLSCYQNEAVPKDWEKHEFKTRNYSSNLAKGGHREARTECVWRKLSPWAQEKQAELNHPTLF